MNVSEDTLVRCGGETLTDSVELPPAVQRYFEGVDNDDVDAAVRAFAADAAYSHPGLGDSPTRSDLVGTDAIRAYLTERGPKPWTHVLTRWYGTETAGICEGLVRGDGGGTLASFVSSVDFDSAGLIRRYVTYASFPSPSVDDQA